MTAALFSEPGAPIDGTKVARGHGHSFRADAKDFDGIDLAQAHLQRAESLAATGDHESAILAFRDSLSTQRDRPNVQTQAWLLFPWFIVENERHGDYDEAAAVLAEFYDDMRLMFPLEKYRCFGALALLSAHSRDFSSAHAWATRAVAASTQVHSGFRYHPTVGLVDAASEWVHERVTALIAE